jgi:hypothetical protein
MKNFKLVATLLLAVCSFNAVNAGQIHHRRGHFNKHHHVIHHRYHRVR